ncbi:MAG TPA: folylpolyglutamate synthase/dihydrofolate synthase family protein [Mycobacteriales bacterium]|nr:folylpolyglutamate synthase/dihydrofolate synthase family protein [Mycobacteriales bacterium]
MARADDRRDLARVEAELSTRWPEDRLDPTLDRIRALVDLLGAPQTAYPVIHVAGTNGKTSTARMIDTLLHGFGLRTGRFTSPHLSSVTERISVDSEPISPRRFVEVYHDVAPYLSMVDGMVDAEQPIRLSYFEVLTAMGFVAFADAPVDVAVVEVGLGGSWDTTNVADGKVAVVTPIGLDHTDRLGDTLAAIAGEKAGIIKPGALAVLAGQEPEAAEVLLRRAGQVGATVVRQGPEFGVTGRRVAVGGQMLDIQGLGGAYPEIFLPLYGAHQAQNAVCALAAVESFFGAGEDTGPISLEVVRQAFAEVSSPGRLEPVRSAPTVLVDAAHNPAGMVASVHALRESFAFGHLVGVVAMLRDKDVRSMLHILEPVLDEIVVTQNSSPRCMAADDLAVLAVDAFGADRVTVETRIDDAVESAVRLAEESSSRGDVVLGGAGVLVTGSVVTAGEARLLLTGAQG